MLLTSPLLAAATDVRARTDLIQRAIDDAHGRGGGTVTVPPGTWTIVTLRLRSGVTLHLARNAVLLTHAHLADYPVFAHGHNKDRQPFHLIVAEDCIGIGITGEGAIDGNDMAFWDPPIRELVRQGVDIDRLVAERGLDPVYTQRNHPWYREKSQRPSPLIELVRCREVLLDGITIRRSPGWTVHCDQCDQLRIRGVTVANNLFGPNTDGFDLNGCRDVTVSDCDLTCGDDAIIIKSTEDSRSSERIAVSNCIVASNCAGLGLGAECTHAIRDIAFTGCVVRQALRAVQIEMWDAGLIENVVFSGITGTTNAPIPLQRAIYLDIQYHKRTDGRLGRMRNIQLSNITLTTRGRIVATAADGSRIEGLVLRDIHLTFPTIEDASVTVPRYRSGQMSNDAPEARTVNALLVASNVDRLLVANVSATWPGEGSNTAGDPGANTDLNPHHGDIPMHGAWLRRCTAEIDAPFLTAFDPRKAGKMQRVVGIDSQISDRQAAKSARGR